MPSKALKPKKKTHVCGERPPFECIALLLQGGGALGSYQAGVYQALAEAGLHPDWVAGISIGAINAAIIAGNPKERRVERLRAFWEEISSPPFGVPGTPSVELRGDMFRTIANQLQAFGVAIAGAPGFFLPRPIPPVFYPPGSPEALSYYDVTPLKVTLERLVDFERIDSCETRFSVGAVNVVTGNFVYFDNTRQSIRPEHVMASGALPPGFPAIEIEGEYYWDGGIVSNTPLQWVLDKRPRQDTLAFQVDLWSARGDLPRDMIEADVRQKEIRFSSRTRATTDQFKQAQQLRHALGRVLKKLPPDQRDDPDFALLTAEADHKVQNIVQLIYRSKRYEGAAKDYEFSRRTMEEHWQAGYFDAVRTLRHPEVLERPKSVDGVFTFDLAVQGRE